MYKVALVQCGETLDDACDVRTDYVRGFGNAQQRAIVLAHVVAVSDPYKSVVWFNRQCTTLDVRGTDFLVTIEQV